MPIKISMEAARVNAGLTQKEFADACGVAECTVINWEKGRTVPKIEMLPVFEKLYGIPLDFVRLGK